MNQIISPRHKTSKELLTLQSTLSNTPLWTNLLSDVTNSAKNVNSRSMTPICQRRCPIHDISNKNRLDYVKELIRSNDKVNIHSDVVVEDRNASTVQQEIKEFENGNKSMEKRTYKTADATDTPAMSFKSQTAFNHSDNVFGVPYDFLEKAIEKIAASTTPDHQDLTLAPPIEEKCISVDHRSLDTIGTSSSIKNRVFTYSRPPEKSLVLNQHTTKSVASGNYLLPNLSHKRSQIPRPKDGSIDEVKIKPSLNLNQIHCKSTRRRSNISSGTANRKGNQSRDSIVQKNELLISQTTAGTRESSSPTQMPSQTKGRYLRQHAGSPVLPLLTTTLGPTLLRTPTVGLHAKVDQYKHQRCASQIGIKTAIQKDQPHQSIRFTTMLDEKPRGRSVRPNHRRVGTQRNFHMNPTDVPSNQKAKTIMTSVSTSASSVSTTASSYSSSAAQETSSSESQESVPLRLMTRQRVAPSSKHDSKARIAREGSMKRSRRVPTADSPQHAGSMAHMENTEKKIGRLRRIKNKLGVIFHHHHHHYHHHHHHDGVEAKVDNTTLSNHHHSFWKYFRKMLHHKSEEGKAKTRLHSGPRKRDTDYGLLDGLRRHIWHSKKSKRSGGIKGMGKSHNHKMKVKKWHWWQQLNKRKGVVRQTSSRKRQVRFGFKAPKKHLRALKLN
ncbi:hypothetical protein FRX31_009823 [Thalictrum thalictroides]|uniref:Uncharacterized protein n=1 Tax=Thalictrum thalictroides TaxID=46969 RepID=A0A7J6WT57_THATH|nr:hypothetical protein FRX31_009823 [Thalictrum thalictroides]